MHRKQNYIGIARLYRGYEYYNLVRQYGDVILVDHVLDVNSPELYAARTDRRTVMDFAYEDLKYAMPSIKAPTLLVWGENDTATPLRDAKVMERLIPDAGLVSFPACGSL